MLPRVAAYASCQMRRLPDSLVSWNTRGHSVRQQVLTTATPDTVRGGGLPRQKRTAGANSYKEATARWRSCLRRFRFVAPQSQPVGLAGWPRRLGAAEPRSHQSTVTGSRDCGPLPGSFTPPESFECKPLTQSGYFDAGYHAAFRRFRWHSPCQNPDVFGGTLTLFQASWQTQVAF